MKKTAKRKSFYTLIEILTVVVIAAILFGIGIPAFTTMIQGNTMTIAVRQFSSKIAAARAYAITNRCNVALLLVENQDHPGAGASDVDKGLLGDSGRHSAYRVCLVDGNNFNGWVEGEDWKTLPDGVLRNGITGGTLTKIQNVPILNINSSGTTNVELNGIVFDKKGQTSASYELKLSRGRYVKDATDPFVYTDRGDGGIGKQALTINQYTGKVTTGEFKYE